MKKALLVSTYGDFLATFELNNIKILKNLGYEVHCASNFENEKYNKHIDILKKLDVKFHEINFTRNPFNFKNIKEYKKLKKIIKEENIYLLDTHNAVTSAYSRLAAKLAKVNKVVYTPHGFFFYKGCPLKNKLIFKPIENLLAHYTDNIICINREDYEYAKKMKLKDKPIYVPGIGIDIEKIRSVKENKDKYKKEFNISNDDKIIIMAGELIERKNYQVVFEAVKNLQSEKFKIIICGLGELKEKLKKQLELLNIKNVIFAGYRLDVIELMKASDIYILSSYQEGLPVALMEAMACGLPAIVSDIRGNIDLIDNNKGGYIFNPNDSKELESKIKKLIDDENLIKSFGEYNYNKIEKFGLNEVKKIMYDFYSKL